MSVFGGSVRETIVDEAFLSRYGIGSRSGSRVTNKQARRHSVMWAGSHVRADLLSLMPVDVFRRVAGVQIESPKPGVLEYPCEVADGQPMPIEEWLYSSQQTLDTTGNFVGIIRKTDGFGLPAEIEPIDPDYVSFKIKGSKIVEYKVADEIIRPEHIWHERQFTVAGLPVGLSPIAHAAQALSAGLSAQQFAYRWFENGGVPTAVLRNEEKTVPRATAISAKAQFMESIQLGEPFVTGKDWTYTPIAAKAAEMEFIAQMQYTDLDLCRFMGVPADLIDVVAQGGSAITYANMLQRNLQFLVINLGGAVKRRERALSRLTVGGRFVKLNRNAVLAMDPKTRAEVFKLRIEAKSITPDQIRDLEDEQPFSEADYAQLERLGLTGARTPNQPQTAGS